MPAVVLWDDNKLGKRAGAIDADTLRVWAKMTTPGQAIPAVPTGDVTFANYQIARRESFHMIPPTASTTPTNS